MIKSIQMPYKTLQDLPEDVLVAWDRDVPDAFHGQPIKIIDASGQHWDSRYLAWSPELPASGNESKEYLLLVYLCAQGRWITAREWCEFSKQEYNVGSTDLHMHMGKRRRDG